MQPTTPEQMERAPVGTYVCGDGYVHFCATPELWGIILWGRPGLETARALGRTLPIEIAPGIAAHGSLVDASRLDGADGTAFQALAWYLAQHGAKLAEQVRCLALVRPGGIGGAMVAGVPEVLRYPYPVEVFGDVPAGLAWLEHHGVGGSPAPREHASAIADLYARAASTPPLLSALRGLLDRKLQAPLTVAEAARKLGASERTLQRKLAEAGTSFQRELVEARVRAAKRLLLDGDAPLTTIALEVGCGSLQHFSALFRKATGASPSDWRRKQRSR